jgi:hypothetical protein
VSAIRRALASVLVAVAAVSYDDVLARESRHDGGRWMKFLLLGLALTLCTLIAPAMAPAVEVGQPAPDFKLPSTTGSDIALSDFRGKKWVFLEFYAADFVPT